MTLRIHAPNPMRVGETANVLVTSDNPGVVSLVYGAGLTGPATVTIEGTRVWRNGLKHGQYLARLQGVNEGQQREGQSWCIEIRADDILRSMHNANFGYETQPIIQSARTDAANRINWNIGFMTWRTTLHNWGFIQTFAKSESASSNAVNKISNAKPVTSDTDPQRFIVINTGGTVYFYNTTGTTHNSSSAFAASTDTMGGTEHLIISMAAKIAKYDRVLSQADREAFQSAGTVPATPQFSYQGAHEIVETAPVFWDSSASAWDASAVTPYLFGPARASGDFTDTVPVIPYALVPVTAVATTDTTIDATRPRQGVPDRASYSERTEVADQCVVTVNDPVGAVGPVINARIKIL